MTIKIPLYGSHVERFDGSTSKGLVMKSSDCPDGVPPTEASRVHRELQQKIDRRKVTDGERLGYIEMDGHDVVDYNVNEKLL